MKKTYLLTAMLLISAIAWSQKVTIKGVYPDEIEGKGFTLSQDASIDIKGTAAVLKDDWRAIVFYGWILNSDTREVVWHQFENRRDYDRDRYRDRDGLFEFSATTDLKKGNYELYFAGAHGNGSWNNNFSVSSIGDIIDYVFDSRDRERYRDRYSDDLSISVTGNGLRPANINDLINRKLEGALVSFNRVRDDEELEKGFNLTGETKLKIYAVGEGTKNQNFDFVRIRNAANREQVFTMNYRNTEFAGGAEKNLKVDEVITLPAGSYVVSYDSDDSHSYEEWNELPPDDPEFWGVTIWPVSAADGRNVAEFTLPATATPLVDLTKVRDDESVSEGFSISKDIEVRILCLGESSGRNMVDYGWITNANTREVVWEMDAYDAEHAGGADKNRIVDEKIRLAAGDYIAHYVTDDSHAYREWNSDRPHEDDLWGISIWATNDSDMSKVKSFDAAEFKNKNVIAEILRVGDDRYIKETFEISKDTEVLVSGLGEGEDGDMYDYGYIKNLDNGNIVWEMRYRNSEHAGGARKNRKFSESLRLEKGTYRIIYETDGSHSYRRWNSTPPRNPEMWGISIIRK